MKSGANFWTRLSFLGLLLVSLLLAACGDYISVTPAPPVAGLPPTTVTVNPDPVPPPTPVIAARPVIIPPGVKNTPRANNVDLPAKPKPTSVPPDRSAFYELPYADSHYFVHVPAGLRSDSPAQVVLAVHGMGSNGVSFATPLLPYADQHHFVLVAPDMRYDSDYFTPAHVAANDGTLLPELDQMIADLPQQTHLNLKPKVLLFGFSRGAQIVHRLAFFYPQDVLGVAAMSAGNYTLPIAQYKTANQPNQVSALDFPFGVADLANYSGHNFDLAAVRQIPFWLSVGGADNAKTDVPPAWNPYLGQTRLDRATHFYNYLKSLDITSSLTVVPGVGHTVCTQMKQDAFAFFDTLQG